MAFFRDGWHRKELVCVRYGKIGVVIGSEHDVVGVGKGGEGGAGMTGSDAVCVCVEAKGYQKKNSKERL